VPHSIVNAAENIPKIVSYGNFIFLLPFANHLVMIRGQGKCWFGTQKHTVLAQMEAHLAILLRNEMKIKL